MASDFLFRKVSETEKTKIKKEAKQILDNFSKKLSKIDKKMPEQGIERPESERAEKTSTESNFSRETMLKNAPNKNKDFIILEKKKW